jgi:hypothetical protein
MTDGQQNRSYVQPRVNFCVITTEEFNEIDPYEILAKAVPIIRHGLVDRPNKQKLLLYRQK